MILYPGRILIVYDAALLVSVIGLRSDYVISDTDVLFSGKQTKILTVRTCLVVGGRNVTNNRLLCSSSLISIMRISTFIQSGVPRT